MLVLAVIGLWLGGTCWRTATGASGSLDILMNLPMPPATRQRLVADDLLQHGSRVTILALESSQPVSIFQQFFRDYWQSANGEAGSIDDTVAGWSLVSRLQAGYLIVVQMRAHHDGGSRGWLSAARPAIFEDPPHAGLTAGPPLPPGARLISSTQSVEDAGWHTVQLVQSDWPLQAITDFYLQAAGGPWRAVLVNAGDQSRLLRLARGGATVDLVISGSTAGSLITLSIMNTGAQ